MSLILVYGQQARGLGKNVEIIPTVILLGHWGMSWPALAEGQRVPLK